MFVSALVDQSKNATCCKFDSCLPEFHLICPDKIKTITCKKGRAVKVSKALNIGPLSHGCRLNPRSPDYEKSVREVCYFLVIPGMAFAVILLPQILLQYSTQLEGFLMGHGHRICCPSVRGVLSCFRARPLP